MRAIVFAEKEKVEIWDDLSPPKIEEPNEILTRTLFTGISTGTERHMLRGGPYSPGFPAISGYQNIGVVEDVGPEVKGVDMGDHILSDFGRPPANYKDKNLKGWYGHQEVRVTNLEQTKYSSYPWNPTAIRLPPGADLEECALTPVASIGLHACRCGRVASGERVLVMGLGIIGQLCAQSARAIGGKVFGCDLDEWRLEMARRHTCDEVFGPEKGAITEGIKRFGPFDVAIETTGSEEVMNSCLDAISHFGRVIAVAGRLQMRYDNIKAQVQEAQIMHTNHFAKEDALEIMRLCRAKKVQIKPLITHKLKLRDAPGFYNWVLKSQEKLLGAIVKW